MRSIRPIEFRTMPYDGLVRLGPQEKLNIQEDALPNPSHDEALETIFRARSSILARIFWLENELVLLQLADRFSTFDPLFGGPEYLRAESKLRKRTLGAHVGEALKVINREARSSELLTSELQDALAVRNALAHRPCWLSPINSPDGFTASFVAMIADERHIWSVDPQQIEEWERLIDRCLSVRELTMGMLSKREQPTRKHDLGSWPLGVRLPPGDPLGHRAPIEVIAQVASVPFEAESRE
jgi:hypothetical protein